MARVRSRTTMLLTTVSILVTITVVAALVLLRPDPPPPTAPAAEPTPPPLPEAVLAAADVHALAPTADGVTDAIDELVRAPGTGRASAAVVDAVTGEHLYGHEPDAPTVPASAIKMVTGAAALAVLGPAHQLPTVVLAGERDGEVVLVGGGDPTLSIGAEGTYADAAELAELAAQVKGRVGDTEVTQVTVDAGLFTGDVHGPWGDHIPGGGHVGPITALMTDGGRVDPAERGTPADRWPEPDLAAGAAFAAFFDGDVAVARGSAPPARTTSPAAPATPTGSAATVDPTSAPGVGAIGAAAADSTASPQVTGPVEPGVELGRVHSPPMVRLVEIMISASDNVLAEVLARHVALARGETASFAGAVTAMTDVMGELDVAMGQSVLADGSGLSRDNRLTAAALTDLLVTALTDPALASIFSGLPVAGWSGTLAHRFRMPELTAGPGAGVVRAKTGNLIGISTLTGLVVTADGRLLAFALLANDAPETAYEQLDEIAAALAECGCR